MEIEVGFGLALRKNKQKHPRIRGRVPSAFPEGRRLDGGVIAVP